MTGLQLLSGGAALGLVDAVRNDFRRRHTADIQGKFSAVGVMRDEFLAGAACDVLILTDALIQQLTQSGHVVAGSARALGKVQTGVAVKAGQGVPDVGTPHSLQAALRASTGIYFPDPVKATAGIHVWGVLKALGLDVALADRLKPFANGATAMAAMAQSSEAAAIGSTQKTEILSTPGVVWVAPLPAPHGLATVYTAAVCAKAAQPELAAQLVELLSGEAFARQRAACGFE